MPFKSEKQRRWMHANNPEMAKKWEKEKKMKRKSKVRELIRKMVREIMTEAKFKKLTLPIKDRKKVVNILQKKLRLKITKDFEYGGSKGSNFVIELDKKFYNKVLELLIKNGIDVKEGVNEDFAGSYPKEKRAKFDNMRRKQSEVLGYTLTGKDDVKTEIDDATIKEELQNSQGEGYTFGKGDIVKDINPDCPHHNAEGEVIKGGKVKITFKVTNNGPTYKEGDELEKTVDQMVKLNSDEVNEGNIGITTKKGKSIYLTHKTSGKEIVVQNTPSVLKKYPKIGYLISMPEAKERNYKEEYKKYGSSTKSKKYRAELNAYNRKKGTYGNGDGKDASHKGGKIVVFEK